MSSLSMSEYQKLDIKRSKLIRYHTSAANNALPFFILKGQFPPTPIFFSEAFSCPHSSSCTFISGFLHRHLVSFLQSSDYLISLCFLPRFPCLRSSLFFLPSFDPCPLFLSLIYFVSLHNFRLSFPYLHCFLLLYNNLFYLFLLIIGSLGPHVSIQ
jgi:hypothetical protein